MQGSINQVHLNSGFIACELDNRQSATAWKHPALRKRVKDTLIRIDETIERVDFAYRPKEDSE